MQAELGDVFIQSALGEQKNTFLLETHSEHLILRIMRRIRETRDGKLPQGVPPVSAKDVSILFGKPRHITRRALAAPLSPRTNWLKITPAKRW